MKENKWVLGLIGIILAAAIWYIYPILFPKQVESTSQEYEQATKLIKEGKLEEAKPMLMKGINKEPGKANTISHLATLPGSKISWKKRCLNMIKPFKRRLGQ